MRPRCGFPECSEASCLTNIDLFKNLIVVLDLQCTYHFNPYRWQVLIRLGRLLLKTSLLGEQRKVQHREPCLMYRCRMFMPFTWKLINLSLFILEDVFIKLQTNLIDGHRDNKSRELVFMSVTSSVTFTIEPNALWLDWSPEIKIAFKKKLKASFVISNVPSVDWLKVLICYFETLFHCNSLCLNSSRARIFQRVTPLMDEIPHCGSTTTNYP